MRLLLLVMLLVGSYWGYSIDLECQLHHCLSQHSDDATGCSAPAKTVDPPLAVICPEHKPVVSLPPIWPLLVPTVLAHQPGWPSDPAYVREIGPPRAPPVLT
ncbi:MAG: hypothetical protein KF760_03725 [Candidatus Eremiobacteraeota bacterium]|nr:hypothetical protein [Candidatus Eremiobacteraeota bacterium]MCW5870804.1 hypothetical protein [Candidatus Eremiobacteraeota bacterium]